MTEIGNLDQDIEDHENTIVDLGWQLGNASDTSNTSHHAYLVDFNCVSTDRNASMSLETSLQAAYDSLTGNLTDNQTTFDADLATAKTDLAAAQTLNSSSTESRTKAVADRATQDALSKSIDDMLTEGDHQWSDRKKFREDVRDWMADQRDIWLPFIHGSLYLRYPQCLALLQTSKQTGLLQTHSGPTYPTNSADGCDGDLETVKDDMRTYSLQVDSQQAEINAMQELIDDLTNELDRLSEDIAEVNSKLEGNAQELSDAINTKNTSIGYHATNSIDLDSMIADVVGIQADINTSLSAIAANQTVSGVVPAMFDVLDGKADVRAKAKEMLEQIKTDWQCFVTEYNAEIDEMISENTTSTSELGALKSAKQLSFDTKTYLKGNTTANQTTTQGNLDASQSYLDDSLAEYERLKTVCGVVVLAGYQGTVAKRTSEISNMRKQL